MALTGHCTGSVSEPVKLCWLLRKETHTEGTAAENIVGSLIFTPIGLFHHKLVGSTVLVTASYSALATTKQYIPRI
jgi:hypothetical protein